MNIGTIRKILVVTALAALFSACTPGTKPDAESTGAAGEGSGAQVGTIGGDSSLAGTALEGKIISYEKNAINDPKNILSIKTIYFDYDSSDIGEENIEVLKHHGKYLSLHTDVNMRLEGHTDERGAREYNVALADRRAQAVKRLLLFQGASASQITIISYGEEKPAAFGHDEEAWKLNRRAELVYE